MVIDRHSQRGEAFHSTHTLTSMPQQEHKQISAELHNVYVQVCKEGRKLALQTELCISTKTNFLRRTGSINLILWLAWVLSVEAFLDKSHHPIKTDRQKSRKQKTTGFVLAQIRPVSWDHQAVSHHSRACSLSSYIRYLSLWHQLWVLWNSVMTATSFPEPDWLKNQKGKRSYQKKRGEGRVSLCMVSHHDKKEETLWFRPLLMDLSRSHFE